LTRDAPTKVARGHEGGGPEVKAVILVYWYFSIIWKVLRSKVLDNVLEFQPLCFQSIFVSLHSEDELMTSEHLNFLVFPGGWKIHNLTRLKVLMPE
jgi:hypothetical protein